MKNNKQPEIRFRGFTEDWEQRKFGDLLEPKDGVRRGPFGSALKKDIFVPESDYVVYEQQNAIYNNYATRYNITKEKFEELKKFSLTEGDFIMSGAGTIGRISRVPKGIKLGVFNQALIRFRINKELTDSEYFIQFVRADNMQRKLTGANPGSAITNLVPMSDVKQWSVLVPSKQEQREMGDFFKTIDDTIALHQQELTALKETKQGFLQKMFPKEGERVPEIRFPGFTDDWEQRKLGDIADSFSGGTPTANNRDYYNGHIPFIRSGEINSDTTELFITEEAIKNSSAKLVNNGDILYALYGATSGEVGISKINGAINQAVLAIKPRFGDDSYFISQWLRKQKQTIISIYLQGGQGNLSGGIVKKLMIDIPISKEEQIKISIFFKQLDNTIALHQRELDLLKETKKAFLQKMFV
ncbi:restriction endonuclease subunit S [Carnobacterium sp. CS13]|uniref:restriction endonuclease subunit S n=1 Tax=Carnobacterium sp. CS13 TaxID=2800128 RepID=UPI00191389D3|nr:restriction endonuclease subunit S [Carnobacterium sp. CS13]QQP70179.1 restriction endonuclease subunit S [Carnobacterium sp. CS13]